MKYTVLNKMSVMDIPENIYETEIERHNEETDDILSENGIVMTGAYANTRYACEFWESKRSETETRVVTIYDAIEMLALKEGTDVVEYEDGNIGIVGYCNRWENGFKILGEVVESEG